MNIVHGDIWKLHDNGHTVGITTNGIIRRDGRAVMGAGIAKQARDRFPGIDRSLANQLRLHGNIPHRLTERLFSFPTKNDWKNKSDINLISNSTRYMLEWLLSVTREKSFYVPKPGCANGGLDWVDVEKAMDEVSVRYDKSVTDRFIIVIREKQS